MSKTDHNGPRQVDELKAGIVQTRSEMSDTIDALALKLDPARLRDRAGDELLIVEAHVKSAVKEQIGEVRIIVQEELRDAKATLTVLMITAKDTVIKDSKEALQEIMVTAKDTVIKDAKDAAAELIDHTKLAVREDVLAVKESVKRDLQEAFTHAKTATRAATLGKIEDFATQVGDVMTNAKDTVVDTVRANPIPAALAGIGLVWLFMNRSSARKGSSIQVRDVSNGMEGYGYSGGMPRTPSMVPHAASGAGEVLSNAQHSVSTMAHDAGEKISSAAHGAQHVAADALHTVSDKAGQAMHAVADAAKGAGVSVKGAASSVAHTASHLVDQAGHAGGQLVHSAGDLAHQAGHAVAELGHQVPVQARRAEKQVERTYFDHPLAFGAAVVGVGVLVGISLPRSSPEDRLMGATRDRLLHDAQGFASEAAAGIRHMGQDPLGTLTHAVTPQPEASPSV